MTVKTCYEKMGADYTDISHRLGSDTTIIKFLTMLYRDKSFSELCKAMEAGEYETAIRAVHTMKGVALNMSLTRLAKITAALTDALRNGTDNDKIQLLYGEVKQDYQEMLNLVGELLGITSIKE